MSRRYGRNQKRAARRRFAELEEAYWLTEGLLRHISRQRDRLQDDLDMVKQALGPQFVGLSPTEIAMSVDRDDGRFKMLAPNDQPVTMHQMMFSTVDACDSPDCKMHVRVKLAGGEVCYAMSQQALWKCEASFLAERIAREMAPMLVAAFRRNGARR